MARNKNILLISIDDGGSYWRFRDAFREPLLTPNLDRICETSTAFTSAYCQAPICGPSRNSMLTGQSPHQTGILDNYTNLFSVVDPEELWQFQLKRAGYFCSTAGKVHHGFVPLSQDIHDVLYSHAPKPISLGPPRSVPMKRYGGLTGGASTTDPAHDPLYYDHQSASDAISFLDGYDGEQPFYREVGFHHPHIPLRTPARFKELYDEDNFAPPDAWAKGFDIAKYPDAHFPANIDLRDIGHWRKSVRNYFSAYSHVDHHIGRVWDALQASPHAKDTIVILFSDHGFHLGDKNRMRKFTLWEESCGVPMIVHDPDAAASEVSDPVALLDIGPTILDFAGLPPLDGALGQSLAPQVHGAAAEPDRAVPTFLFGNVTMRKGSYRITRYENGDCEFQDVDGDPWLTCNLAGDHPFFADMLTELGDVAKTHGLDLDGGTEPGLAWVQPTHFATLAEDGVAALPDGYERMHYGADGAGDVTHFVAVGNGEDNTLFFGGSQNRFQLDVHPGPAHTQVVSQNDDLVVYCDSGDTDIRGGNAPCVVYGGSGHDVIRCGAGAAWIDGGAGPAEVYAGTGPTEFISGTGANKLVTGKGKTRIKLTGGCTLVEVNTEDLHVTITRTGLPQKISGFRCGTVDISDWSVTGAAKLSQDGGDAVLSCVSERVVFLDTLTEDLRPSLVGTLAEAEHA